MHGANGTGERSIAEKRARIDRNVEEQENAERENTRERE
jgi:hypothetical protein